MLSALLQTPPGKELRKNPHIWIIALLSLCLLVLYYGWTEWFPWWWHLIIREYKYNINGILFLIPFLYSVFKLGWKSALLVWGLSIVAILPRVVDYSPGFAHFIRNMLALCAPPAILLFIVMELKWREKQRETMVEREQERKLYMAQILKAQEDERRRIAQELHDETIQALLLVANRAQKIASGQISAGNEVEAQANWINDNILSISNEIRRISRDLRPSILDNVGLVSAIKWMTERINEDGIMRSFVRVKGKKRSLKPEAEIMLFRIVQEALSNARKHSAAAEVLVEIEYQKNFVIIKVRDNGKGYLQQKPVKQLAQEGKLGILGMQQRIQYLNGELNINSNPEHGTEVVINVPDG